MGINNILILVYLSFFILSCSFISKNEKNTNNDFMNKEFQYINNVKGNLEQQNSNNYLIYNVSLSGLVDQRQSLTYTIEFNNDKIYLIKKYDYIRGKIYYYDMHTSIKQQIKTKIETLSNKFTSFYDDPPLRYRFDNFWEFILYGKINNKNIGYSLQVIKDDSQNPESFIQNIEVYETFQYLNAMLYITEINSNLIYKVEDIDW